VELAVFIDIAEHRCDEFRVLQLIAQEKPALLQRNAMSDVGGAQNIAIRYTRPDVLAQPLKGDLGGGADDIHLNAGVFRGERPPDAF